MDAIAFRTRARTDKRTAVLDRTPVVPDISKRTRKRRPKSSWNCVRARTGRSQRRKEKSSVDYTDSDEDENSGHQPPPSPRGPPSPASSSSDVVIVDEVQGPDKEVKEVVTFSPRSKRRCLGGVDTTSLPTQPRGTVVSPLAGSGHDLEDEEDFRIVGVTGQVVTRDLPHPRPDCAEHRFSLGCSKSNKQHCNQCYCYVCDCKASECEFWGSGMRERDHSNARPHRFWNHLRQAARSGNKALIRAEFAAASPLTNGGPAAAIAASASTSLSSGISPHGHQGQQGDLRLQSGGLRLVLPRVQLDVASRVNLSNVSSGGGSDCGGDSELGNGGLRVGGRSGEMWPGRGARGALSATGAAAAVSGQRVVRWTSRGVTEGPPPREPPPPPPPLQLLLGPRTVAGPGTGTAASTCLQADPALWGMGPSTAMLGAFGPSPPPPWPHSEIPPLYPHRPPQHQTPPWQAQQPAVVQLQPAMVQQQPVVQRPSAVQLQLSMQQHAFVQLQHTVLQMQPAIRRFSAIQQLQPPPPPIPHQPDLPLLWPPQPHHTSPWLPQVSGQTHAHWTQQPQP